MSIEYMLVICPDECPVRADGNGVGFTNHTLILPGDEYTVTVDTQGCIPASVDVVLTGTSLVRPCIVMFTRDPAAQAAPSPAPRSPATSAVPAVATAPAPVVARAVVPVVAPAVAPVVASAVAAPVVAPAIKPAAKPAVAPAAATVVATAAKPSTTKPKA